MTSTLPLTLELDGKVAHWAWAAPRGVLPVGVVIDHDDHVMLVSWASYAGGPGPEYRLTLDSLQPLTVLEPVRCTICGLTGQIEQGAWLPAEDGGGS